MSRRAVVVGGFTTGRRILEPVAEAVCSHFGFSDADVFTFTDAISNPQKLDRALRRQAAVVHSAGFLAIRECYSVGSVMAINSPEPHTVARLLANGAIKSGNLWKMHVSGPHRTGVARVIASNVVQATTHPIAHIRQINAVSQFSTTQQLELMDSAGVSTARIDTVGCEFFGPHTVLPWDGNRAVLTGCHDQVLIDPVSFVGELPKEALTT